MEIFSDSIISTSENVFIGKFQNDISLYIKREDLLHPQVSGNKFRKLKYNIQEALLRNEKTLLTFGGAYSNHISATAAAGKLSGLETIGVIRGEELGADLPKTLLQNPTLGFADSCGMKLHFVSRNGYSKKTESGFLEDLRNKFGSFYVLPEGGTNKLAIKGCEEILSPTDKKFDFVCCPAGTGGTISGIINSSEDHQEVMGFSALKGTFLEKEIEKLTRKRNWKLVSDFHFGGYAKVSAELIQFINDFKRRYKIQLDPVYTGKMMFGIMELIEKSEFPQNSRILAVHTGGLQGIEGMNNVLKNKNLPLIDV
ncbi:MAG: pyridoxal-phosphate dependent enzyme [Gillisia sp.]